MQSAISPSEGRQPPGKTWVLAKLRAALLDLVEAVVDRDRLQQHQPVGGEQLAAAAEEVVEVLPADRLDHLDRDQLVVAAAQVAVVLEQDRDPVARGRPRATRCGGQLVLLAGDRRRRHPAAVLAGGVDRQPAPAGADLQQVVLGAEPQPRGRSARASPAAPPRGSPRRRELGARVDHPLVEEGGEELVAEVVVGGDVRARAGAGVLGDEAAQPGAASRAAGRSARARRRARAARGRRSAAARPGRRSPSGRRRRPRRGRRCRAAAPTRRPGRGSSPSPAGRRRRGRSGAVAASIDLDPPAADAAQQPGQREAGEALFTPPAYGRGDTAWVRLGRDGGGEAAPDLPERLVAAAQRHLRLPPRDARASRQGLLLRGRLPRRLRGGGADPRRPHAGAGVPLLSASRPAAATRRPRRRPRGARDGDQVPAPGGQATDLLGMTTPLFLARTPEDFLELLQPRKPDPETGEPDLEKIGAYPRARIRRPSRPSRRRSARRPRQLRPARLQLAARLPPARRRRGGTWVRYRIEPEAGEATIEDEEAQSRDADYLRPSCRASRLRPGRLRPLLRPRRGGRPASRPDAAWPRGAPPGSRRAASRSSGSSTIRSAAARSSSSTRST